MEDGFFLSDLQGRITLFNGSAERLLGIHPSCLFEGGYKSHNALLSRVLDECASARSSGVRRGFEAKSEAGADLQIGISPVLSKYGEKEPIGTLAIVKDVTEKNRIETMRKDFVATVSHEFRTPLTLISGVIEMLRMYDDLPRADRSRSLEMLEIETERLKKLISELLMLSKMENRIFSSEPGSIDVARVLGQVMAALAPLAQKKGQSLELSQNLRAAPISGDESWFFHAIQNLVENAIKYTPAGGAIAVEAVSGESELRIAVRDNGIGIAPEDIDRVFERFYRADKSRGSETGGSGLGLAIAKDIISLLNGEISVESRLGSGSVFTVRIPLARDAG
jgi:two-component system phosphate regulon sensor histidine kinase PhoR